jgi:serine phosphatase RsbU (regulator of sigma subunit)
MKSEGNVGRGNVDYKGLSESLQAQYESLSFELRNIQRIDGVLDTSLEQMVNRENINDILDDIAGIFRYTADFVHSEMNVFAHSVRDFVGMSYNDFSKKKLSEIIDSSVSKFSNEQLAVLGNDIKQTSYLLINNEAGKVFVSDSNDLSELRKVFAPVHAGYSAEDIERELADKVSKTTAFGIKSHLSVLLHSFKVDGSGKRKIPIGYFHLTKRNEFSDFDFWLVNRIVNHSAVVIDNYFNLKKKEKLLEEVNTMRQDDIVRASNIVSKLVPSVLPSIEGFDFASLYEPAVSCDVGGSKGIGGDCFDVIRLDDRHLGLMMFDVCGHGIPAAMISSNAKSAFVKNFDATTPLPEVFDRFIADMRKVYSDTCDEYLTALLGRIDTETLEFSYCGAGNPYPFVYRASAKHAEKLDAKGFMLRFDMNLERYERKTVLGRGDYVVLFTDGLVDVVNKRGDFSLKDDLYSMKGFDFKSSPELLSYIVNLRSSLIETSFNDDTTCLIVGVKK